MVTKVIEDIGELWVAFKKDMTDQQLRNALIERYLPLVRYNAERVWSKLPDGVDLNDLISAGVFGRYPRLRRLRKNRSSSSSASVNSRPESRSTGVRTVNRPSARTGYALKTSGALSVKDGVLVT